MNIRNALLAVGLAFFSATASAGELTVSAASSLSNAFADIARAYEHEFPGSRVNLNTAASGTLLQQIAHGAPVDVFASADEFTMDLAIKRGLVAAGDSHLFAGNTLVVVIPKKGARVVPKELRQLLSPQISKVALGNPDSVPVGRYARNALESAALWSSLSAKMINTQNVRQSLDYVARGEVDAGFVYGSDARSMQDRVTLAFRVPTVEPINYPIARVASSRQAEEARRFIAFVRSPRGLNILLGHGFAPPER